MKPCVCVNANETEDLFTKTAKVKRFQIAGSNFQVNLKGFKKNNPKTGTKLASCLTTDAGNPHIIFVPDEWTLEPESSGHYTQHQP